MIKDENGVLVGYVFADIEGAQRDLGGWVKDAKALVQERLAVPAGFRLQWTGQYEFLADMEARMRFVLPLTFALIVALLYLSLRGWPQTLLVILSLPFAIAGSVWLLALLEYNLSTAVWVGLIAVGGVAAQTGIVVIVYLDQAFNAALEQGRLRTGEDVDCAVIEGATKCLRPMLMTVATTVLGLMPLLWSDGVGADLSARTAAPVVGGLWSCMFLTLLVLPAAYAIWRRWQLQRGRVAGPVADVAIGASP
jgi:copper/silver efflux system protein